VALLDDLDEAEQGLLAAVGGLDKASQLQPLSWSDLGPRVCVPHWENFVKKHGAGLAGLTARGLSTVDWALLGSTVASSLGEEQTGGEPEALAEYTVRATLGLMLARHGFRVDAAPGSSVSFVKGNETLNLSDLRARVVERTEEWTGLCERLGIADLDLSRSAYEPTRG
jgi:hypothetical protein